MNQRRTVNQGRRVLVGNYGRAPVTMVRGRNAALWDADGNKYLDLFAGFGACGLGHCPPQVSAAIRKQSALLLHVPNTFYSGPQIELAQAIRKAAGYPVRSFFCNGGTEATEAAIKLARLYGAGKRHKIIVAADGFHGRTMGALSATAQKKHHTGFEPMLEGFRVVPFNDPAAVEKAVDDRTVAVMMEVIQGEGGVTVPDDEFFPRLRALCDRHDLLLICDEVWTGMGRTGKMFAHQLYKIQPDIFTLGKALGGGVPAAAMVARAGLAALMKPGTHGSTLGGNCTTNAAGVAVFATIQKQKLPARATRLGKRITRRLEKLAAECPRIKEIRGKGLMLGIELTDTGADVVGKCFDAGVLINCTQGNVIRLAPPMTIPEKDLDRGVEILCNAIAR